MGLFSRDRTVSEMALDPEFLFRVGRLLGATEMAGHILAQSEVAENRRLGVLLLDRLAWFPAEDGNIQRDIGEPLGPLTGSQFDGAETEMKFARDADTTPV